MCDKEAPRCGKFLKDCMDGVGEPTDEELNAEVPESALATPQPTRPAAASCANCQKDDTIHKSMGRCGKCKLVRYAYDYAPRYKHHTDERRDTCRYCT